MQKPAISRDGPLPCSKKSIGMYRISGSGWPDISGHFFESGAGSGQNGTRYRISQPDSARSFLAVS